MASKNRSDNNWLHDAPMGLFIHWGVCAHQAWCAANRTTATYRRSHVTTSAAESEAADVHPACGVEDE
jgi:hypothetical protein